MGQRLQVHPTSVTSIVRRLEASGLIRRLPHPRGRPHRPRRDHRRGPRTGRARHRRPGRRRLRDGRPRRRPAPRAVRAAAPGARRRRRLRRRGVSAPHGAGSRRLLESAA
ncbi:MarR family transcriptional regulator [Nocardioides sp. TF02-7]|uniref:MarR family transcriptional regulator n=1 Tax=Nocardioides sp. TF02-7 TaxID=2917724 RepID=UPI001F06C80E|nr:MarR family transcriptional regulator [Nocardioides sp. TF02-7]UMG92995.1 MarR family transcriptional regulator [Nocardioides sp. TF02-7]